MCWLFWDAMIFCNNFMLPKRRFWTVGQTFQNAFSKHVSTICSPNRVLTPLKSASKRHSEHPSATSPLFFDNLHFDHFDKSSNHESKLKFLSKCSKWRLSKKRGPSCRRLILKRSSDRPKSSFGRGKLCKMITV